MESLKIITIHSLKFLSKFLKVKQFPHKEKALKISSEFKSIVLTIYCT